MSVAILYIGVYMDVKEFCSFLAENHYSKFIDFILQYDLLSDYFKDKDDSYISEYLKNNTLTNDMLEHMYFLIDETNEDKEIRVDILMEDMVIFCRFQDNDIDSNGYKKFILGFEGECQDEDGADGNMNMEVSIPYETIIKAKEFFGDKKFNVYCGVTVYG